MKIDYWKLLKILCKFLITFKFLKFLSNSLHILEISWNFRRNPLILQRIPFKFMKIRFNFPKVFSISFHIPWILWKFLLKFSQDLGHFQKLEKKLLQFSGIFRNFSRNFRTFEGILGNLKEIFRILKEYERK